jgi:Mycothiol maleylpyruvate isomerase N-terminal domain
MTDANQTVSAYLNSADAALALVGDPAVAAAWDKPSALPGMSARALAAHLTRQIFVVSELLAADPPQGEPVSLLDHYARVQWIGKDLDDEVNVKVRRTGETLARGGAARLAGRADAALAELRDILPGQPDDRLVSGHGDWLLTLPDYLVTRLVEIAVHADDLAVSAGIPAPDLPPGATDTVLTLLTRLAARRHGTAAVLRALSRSERAPATIAAF